MGAGLELAVACDFRIATLRSEFAFPEVRLGMIPGSGGTQRALRLIGMTRAKLFMMTGQRIPAERAEAWGLITQAVPDDGLDAAVGALAGELAERPPLALRTLKMVLNRGADAPLETALELERKAYAWLALDARLRGGRAVVPREAAAEIRRGGRLMGRADRSDSSSPTAPWCSGAVKARDLLDLRPTGRGRRRLRHGVGRRQPAGQAAAGVGHAALGAGRRDAAQCAWASAAWPRSSTAIR